VAAGQLLSRSSRRDSPTDDRRAGAGGQRLLFEGRGPVCVQDGQGCGVSRLRDIKLDPQAIVSFVERHLAALQGWSRSVRHWQISPRSGLLTEAEIRAKLERGEDLTERERRFLEELELSTPEAGFEDCL
jgi:hypothetical protein